jgi:hypothetical protein
MVIFLSFIYLINLVALINTTYTSVFLLVAGLVYLKGSSDLLLSLSWRSSY